MTGRPLDTKPPDAGNPSAGTAPSVTPLAPAAGRTSMLPQTSMSPMTKLRGENDNDDRRDQDRRKGRENAFVALWVVLLLIGAFWLVDAFIKNSRQQECFARGGNNCVKLEIPPPAR